MSSHHPGVGYCDGNEIGGEEFTIWMYGADAAPLAEFTKTVALDHNPPPGCSLFIRHGGVQDEDAREKSYSIT
jgi:hypothetical protein